MIKYAVTFCLLILANALSAQLLKNLGHDIKRDAEWKLNRKVRQTVDQGIDSLTKKKKKNQDKPATTQSPAGSTNAAAKEQSQAGRTNSGEGFITLLLSTPVTSKGLPVTFSGESIRYDKWKSVKISIKGPNDPETTTVALSDSGNYTLKYDDLKEEGNYTITATSSDGKATASAELLVLDWTQPDDETEQLKKTLNEAMDLLHERTEDLKSSISAKNKAEVDKRSAEIKEKADLLKKLLQDLQATRKEVAQLYKQHKAPSSNIRDQLSELNKSISGQASGMEEVLKIAKHKTQAFTVCEKIVLVNEACAAFSTFTNVTSKSIAAILKNIVLDKGVPKSVEVMSKGRVNTDFEWGAKEASKIYATSLADAEGLVSVMGKAGFAGDLVQYATDVLLKVYCGIYKGKLTHKYKLSFRNEEGKVWWAYSVTAEAAFTLRYPNTQKSGIIRMKGNIEGNAIKFTFQADPDENPEYKGASSKNLRTTVVKNFTPFTLPSSMALQDELGFGMLARAVATPAYFNLLMDAEYDTETGKIKLFLTDALMDYSPAIFNRQFFVQWPAGLPVLRLMDYPIHKAKLTINAVLKDNNEFEVTKDHSGLQSFGNQIKRNVGSTKDPTEHNIELSISAKKEN